MNKKSTLVFLFYAAKTLHSFAMHNSAALPVIPFEVDNRSNIVVTVLYDVLSVETDAWKKFEMVFPGRLCTKGHMDTPLIHCVPQLAEGKGIRIATSQGHFAAAIDPSENPPVISFGLATGTGWIKFAPVSLVGLIKITARVQEDGSIKLILHKHTPQDGRPDVSLLAYEELLGKQEYASPEQILGITSEIKPKEAYRKRIDQFCAIYVHYSEAEGIKQLIKWAAEKLGKDQP